MKFIRLVLPALTLSATASCTAGDKGGGSGAIPGTARIVKGNGGGTVFAPAFGAFREWRMARRGLPARVTYPFRMSFS